MHLKEFSGLRETHSGPLSRVYGGRNMRRGRLALQKRYGKRDAIRRDMLGQLKDERDTMIRTGKHLNVEELYGAFETAGNFGPRGCVTHAPAFSNVQIPWCF